MSEPRIAALIPTYDNPATIARVVDAVRAYLPDVLIVDDGSGPEGARACAELSARGIARVVRRPKNGGKGAAVKTGLDELARVGFTHAFQVDADGQHTFADIPRFVASARAHPEALVLGSPQFDASAPRARLLGRQITVGLVHLQTAGRVITDPMCGFRVYPIAAARAARARGDAMDFDPEVAVGIAWRGTPVLNLPTRVRYVTRAEGGVSHFRMVRDNLLIAWMHTRLILALVPRLLMARRPRRIAP
ncbi:MAG: glycosyltransferase family 2 protein [Polyangiales bacterium]